MKGLIVGARLCNWAKVGSTFCIKEFDSGSKRDKIKARTTWYDSRFDSGSERDEVKARTTLYVSGF